MAQHHDVRQRYYQVFAILMGLTLVTVGVAFIDIEPLNTILALSIATGKATLVVLYFMHLRDSHRLVWLCVGAGAFWLMLLLIGTLHDYLTRGWFGPAV